MLLLGPILVHVNKHFSLSDSYSALWDCKEHLHVVCCKDQRVQPLFRNGRKLPIDELQDHLHVCCSNLLDLHNFVRALCPTCLQVSTSRYCLQTADWGSSNVRTHVS